MPVVHVKKEESASLGVFVNVDPVNLKVAIRGSNHKTCSYMYGKNLISQN